MNHTLDLISLHRHLFFADAEEAADAKNNSGVMRGDMSLVGPDLVEAQQALHHGIEGPELLLARPGVVVCGAMLDTFCIHPRATSGRSGSTSGAGHCGWI